MLACVRRLNDMGALCTVDLLGENIQHLAEAQEALQLYQQVLEVLNQSSIAQPGCQSADLRANISIKLTQLGLLHDADTCAALLHQLLAKAAAAGNFVRLDMEDSRCTTPTLEQYLRARQHFDNVGIVIQAYLRRSRADVLRILEAGAGHVRLCKGIYRESRTLAYPDPYVINQNYAYLLETLMEAGAYAAIATHDEKLVWEAERLISKYNRAPEQYEFQLLLGVDPALRQLLQDAGHRVRVYVPFGVHWHAYCMRRFRENPRLMHFVFQNLRRDPTVTTDASRRAI
ncbi:MAG: proline dehydrogenase family protein [Candidatus Melainabacteria bacterium]|nr:proline dehydrogenase family protein [Candidatus Melainabacteria bacterium]